MTQNLPPSVLVATPDRRALRTIETALNDERLSVALASNSDDAFALAETQRPALVVLDRDLPPAGALRLCAALRSAAGFGETRIVILGDGEDRDGEHAAHEAGADAYLPRNLATESLLRRLAELERRLHAAPGPAVLTAGSIEMVPEQWIVSVDRKPVHLTHIEYRLLRELMEVRGRVLTRETLMERVWGHSKSQQLETRTLDVHMSRLRNKLRSASESIVTVRNVGYRIDFFADWLGR